MPKLLSLLTLVGLFFLSAGSTFFIVRALPASSGNTAIVSPTPLAKTNPNKSKIDPSVPRTEPCPLNGALFTKQERDIWEKRRPLGVMIENSTDARPQSGLSTADVVYEAVAEGGITRFMALFYCNAAMAGNIEIAPVRSARIYFVNLISEYDGLYTHVGGAGHCDDPNVDPRAKALCSIRTNRIKDLDQMGYAGSFKICHRVTNRLDKEVAYEHTMSCFLDEIYKKAADLSWNKVDEKGVAWDKGFTPWKFQKAEEKSAGTPATDFSYHFWGNSFGGAFDVQWKYNASTNSYARSNGGEQSIDLNTKEPLTFNTVVVEFAKETQLGDLEKHMFYDVIGTNKAQIFMDGVMVEGTWSKATRTSRTTFKDSKGKEVMFNPGPIWISIIPAGNTVTVN